MSGMNEFSHPLNPQHALNRTLVEGEIAGCEHEIRSLEQLTFEARQRRLALDEKLNATALINVLLPRDVLTEIFFLVCEENWEHGSPKDLPGPFFLGKICKYWRKLVWSTARLWAIVIIRCFDDGISDAKREPRFKLLEEWLVRAQGCKLQIRLERTRPLNPKTIPMATFRLLLNYSSQWKVFHSYPFPKLAKIMQENQYLFPELVSLTLTGTSYETTTRTPLDFILSPIQEATIMQHTIMNPGLQIDWMQLRTLTLAAEGMPERLLLDLLRTLINLQYLKITTPYIWKRDQKSSTITPCLLPALEQLHIEDEADYCGRFMSALSLPKLHGLEVTSLGREYTWITEAQNLLNRSKCRLQVFVVSTRDLKPKELYSLFPSLESIGKLRLKITYPSSDAALSDITINALNPNISSDGNVPNHFLPNLTTFEYHGPVDFDFDTMTSMLQSRLKYSSDPTSNMKPLKTFDVKYTNMSWISRIAALKPNSIAPFYIEIARLASLGTKLDIIYPEKS